MDRGAIKSYYLDLLDFLDCFELKNSFKRIAFEILSVKFGIRKACLISHLEIKDINNFDSSLHVMKYPLSKYGGLLISLEEFPEMKTREDIGKLLGYTDPRNPAINQDDRYLFEIVDSFSNTQYHSEIFIMPESKTKESKFYMDFMKKLKNYNSLSKYIDLEFKMNISSFPFYNMDQAIRDRDIMGIKRNYKGISSKYSSSLPFMKQIIEDTLKQNIDHLDDICKMLDYLDVLNISNDFKIVTIENSEKIKLLKNYFTNLEPLKFITEIKVLIN